MRMQVVAMLAMTAAIAPAARAEQATPAPAAARPAEEAAFDRAAELMGRDALAARTQFEKAADLYEATLTQPLSQYALARTFYNLGTARQLAGDDGRAMLAFRRADLLAPATPGLAERVAAIRASSQSIESGGAAMAVGTGPGASTVAKKQAATSADAAAVVRAWVLSAPRVWLWWGAIGAWAAMWGVLVLRMALAERSWRPGRWMATCAAVVCAACGGLLATMVGREVRAQADVVVLREIVPRAQPDDLTGQPAGGALRPGAELAIAEEREGGDGQMWARVRHPDAEIAPDEQGMWVPMGSVGRVVER